MNKLRPPKRNNLKVNLKIQSFRNPQEQLQEADQQSYQVYLLASVEEVKNASKGQATYIWVDKNIRNEQFSRYFKQMSEQLQIQGCSSIQDAKQIIKSVKWQFKLICSRQILKSIIDLFAQDDRLVHIYIFSNKETSSKQKSYSKLQSHDKIIFQTDDIVQLKQKVYKNRLVGNAKAILPNFIKITNNSDLTQLNYSRMIIHSLLISKNDQKAKQDFVHLAKYVYNNRKDVVTYQSQYRIDSNFQKAIKQYTKQSFYYRLINDTIKSSLILPLHLSYIRFPIKSLYKAIKSMFKIQKLTKQAFTCYRGGYIHKQQLEYFLKNQKGYIQVQGFLSASKFIQKAYQFAGNCLFIININQKSRDQQSNHGFCFLNSKSLTQYQKQGEVLFNILNVMQITAVKKIERNNKKLYEIHLQYGSLAQIIQKRKDGILLNLEERKCLTNYENQKKNIKLIANQGDCLRFMNQFSLAIKFYNKFIQGYRKNKFKVDQVLISAYNNLAVICFQKEDFSMAQRCYQKVKIYLQTQKPKQYFRMSAVYNSLGLIKNKQQQNQKSLNYYQQAIQLIKDHFGENSQQLISIYNNLAGLYYKINQKSKAIQFYQKALKLVQASSRSIKVANLYSNVAVIYNEIKNYQRALNYLKNALQIIREINGQKDIETAKIHQMIGNTYKFSQRPNQALQHLTKALQSKKQKLGQSHKQVQSLRSQIEKIRSKNTNFVYIPAFKQEYQKNDAQTGMFNFFDKFNQQKIIQNLNQNRQNRKERQSLKNLERVQIKPELQFKTINLRSQRHNQKNNGMFDLLDSYLDTNHNTPKKERYQQKQVEQQRQKTYDFYPSDLMDQININRANKLIQRKKEKPNLFANSNRR